MPQPKRKPQAHRPVGLALLALVLVLLVKSVVLIQLSDHVLLKPGGSPDSTVYVNLATRVTSGNWTLSPGLYFVSPLYIYFLAAILASTGSVLVAKVVQILLGTVAVGLMWLVADQWFDRRAAWLSFILGAMTGLFTFYEVTFLQASLDVFLTSAFLAALTFALLRSRDWLAFLAGAIAGIQTLNRPNVILAVLLILITLTFVRRWRLALVLGIGLILGIAPVVARNRIAAGEWSLSTSHGGLNFLIGNSGEATGIYRPPAGIRPNIAGQIEDTRRIAEAARGRALKDSEVSAYFTDLGLSWIRDNPGPWLRLMATKLYYTFHSQHIALPLSYPFFAHDTGSALAYLFVGPWLLLPLGCFGLIACAPRLTLRHYVVWVAFVPAYAASVAIFFVSERYRLPLLVPLTIGSGAALGRIWLQLRRGEWMQLTRDGAILALLAVAMNWPLGWPDGDGRFDQRIQMAETLAASGDNDGAQLWAARGLAGNPYEVEGRLRIGRAFAERGNWTLAMEHFEAAQRLDASSPTVALELVRALMALGRADSASKIVAAQPAVGSEDPETWLALGRRAMSLRIPTKGEEFFAQAARLAPASLAAKQELGVAQIMTGKYQPAADQLSEVIKLDSSNADAWAYLALAYFHLGRFDDASRCANAAIERKPDHELAHQVRKQVLIK